MKPFRYSFFIFLLFLPECFAQITLNALPARVIGQDSLTLTGVTPNLVEGRELLDPQDVAIDTSTSPPAIYVADTGNNRVLGFRSATGFVNGAKADVVLGQPDLVTTLPQGPNRSTRSTGTTAPTAVAVDSAGNVYIADAGNSRILRFPKPFAQTGDQLPDLVIGQSTFSTNDINQGGISAATLALSSTTNILLCHLTFDSAGNLWVADAGNNRVLRYKAADLAAATPGPNADLVLGQSNFTDNTFSPPANTNPANSLTAFSTPSGIAFDSAGRFFVLESTSTTRGRVLMWTPPFSTGQAASRLLGVDNDNPQPPFISELQLSAIPSDVFPIDNGIGVADTLNNRILIYPPVDQWSAGTDQAAIQVVGQPDFSSGSVNQGQPFAAADRLANPTAALFFGSELYIADSSNNRVIVMPQTGGSFDPSTRVLGQDQLDLNAPNLVEGREFNFDGGQGDAGLAVDLSSNPPHLYVADTYNNRILGFNDLRNLKPGQKADLVIGQPDFRHAGINYPTGDVNKPSSSSLAVPVGLAVDSSGNLYVADAGNARVLRFPQPFAHYVPGSMMQADLVLGQLNFTTRITDASARTMSQPYGLAFASNHGFLVSDLALNRVLYFSGQSSDFVSGQSATKVIGQPDFVSGSPGSGLNQFSAPHHIAADADDRLYVADTGNARVEIFDNVPASGPNSLAAFTLTNGLSSPRGVYVNGPTGDIWVEDAGNAQSVRYPQFNQLLANGFTPNAILQQPVGPRASAGDAWGDLFVADTGNRVTIYYPGVGAINAANFLNNRVLAPGMIAALFTQGNQDQFGGSPNQAASLPLPTTLNGLQVFLNDTPAPIFYADANQINIQVPMSAPQSGIAELKVQEVATGRLLGDETVLMTNVNPGLFTQAGSGIGAAAALNQDNTLNSQTNPAAQGTVIQLFGTGQGFIPGAPADGNISNGPLETPLRPTIIMGTAPVPDANVKYAGLAPTLVGVWQINVLIPDTVITLPTNPTQVIAIQNSVPSGGGGLGRPVLIYVKAK